MNIRGIGLSADSGNTPNSVGLTHFDGGLPVVLVVASGITNEPVTLTDSSGANFLLIGRAVYSNGCVCAFVSDTIFGAGVSHSVEFDVPSGNATGTLIMGLEFGTLHTGLAAVQQFGVHENGLAGNHPTVTLAAGLTSTNASVGIVGNQSRPISITGPLDWQQYMSGSYKNPNTGGSVVARESNFWTVNELVWGVSDTNFAAMFVEIK